MKLAKQIEIKNILSLKENINSIFHTKKSIIQNYIDARIIKRIENVNLFLYFKR